MSSVAVSTNHVNNNIQIEVSILLQLATNSKQRAQLVVNLHVAEFLLGKMK